MAELTGTIEKRGVGVGAWALVTAEQGVYELHNLPTEFQEPNIKVLVNGTVKEDVMSIAMIGTVFEVHQCTKI